MSGPWPARVLVVGGGVGGLTLAIALEQAGIEVAVFDTAPDPLVVDGGITVWSNAMRVLDRLGVGESVRAHGVHVEQMEHRTDDGRLLATWPIGDIGRKHGLPSAAIERSTLRRVLASHLPDGVVRLGTKFEDLEQNADGVTLRLSDGREERGSVLVGADGIRSAVRQALFGDVPVRYGGLREWRSVVRLDADPFDSGTYLRVYGGKRCFGLRSIGDGWWQWYGTEASDERGGAGVGAEFKEEAWARFKDWYSPIRTAIEETEEQTVVTADQEDVPQLDTWTKGRATLLGDAAHAPLLMSGQGACMAIEDAAVLAEELISNADVPMALARYEHRRRRRAHQMLRRGRMSVTLFHATNPSRAMVRYALLKSRPRVMLRAFERTLAYEV